MGNSNIKIDDFENLSAEFLPENAKMRDIPALCSMKLSL